MGERQVGPAMVVYGALFRRLLIGMLSAGLLLVAFMAIAGGFRQLADFDRLVTEYIQGLAGGRLTAAMLLLSSLGSAAASAAVLLAVDVYLWRRLRHVWEPLLLSVCLGGAWLLNEALKLFYQRARPDLLRLTDVRGFSFPSGHAMISLAFYGMLAYLLWINARHRLTRLWAPAVALLVLPLLIGVSRIYLGVHYPSDVLGGFAAGGAWLAACVTALRAIRWFQPYPD